jgi:predicted nucleic acid-binding protein
VKIFLDTSVLIAAFIESDPNHERCRHLLLNCRPDSASCGSHTIAEFCSALTRMPRPFQLAPEQAWHLVEEIRSRVTPIALSSDEHCSALRDALQSGVKGGVLYDALLLACARKQNPDRICTLNVKHFRAVAPDLADRIVTP